MEKKEKSDDVNRHVTEGGGVVPGVRGDVGGDGGQSLIRALKHWAGQRSHDISGAAHRAEY